MRGWRDGSAVLRALTGIKGMSHSTHLLNTFLKDIFHFMYLSTCINVCAHVCLEPLESRNGHQIYCELKCSPELAWSWLNTWTISPAPMLLWQNILEKHLMEDLYPLLTSTGTRHAYSAYTYIQDKNTKRINILFFF